MSFPTWLEALRVRLQGQCSRTSRRFGNRRRILRRLLVEGLEDRQLLTFGAAVDYPVGTNPLAVVSADFNNDGHLDLATANYDDGTVSALLGDGRGGFSVASNFGAGANPASVSVGDFDGDGKLDLVTASQNVRYASVLLGNNDGTFRPPVTTDTSHKLYGTPQWMAPVAADFNTDGKTDLAFVTSSPSAWFDGFVTELEVLLSDGRGGFASRSSYGNTGGYFPGLAVADLNADGKLDVVMAQSVYDPESPPHGDVRVWLNGRFTYSFVTSSFPQSLAVGDFTRDGIPDLVIGSETLDVWPGNGDGSFGSPVSTSTVSTTVKVADFNGDGKLDVDSGGSVLLGLGDGTFTAPVAVPTWDTAGDFNGDGLPDAAHVDSGSNLVQVFPNDGNWPPVPQLPPVACIGNATVTEGNTGTTSANFIVTLSEPSTATITVNYATGDASATADSDYQTPTGTLTFAPGETSKTISVLVNGDRLPESNETFVVDLSSPTNATIGDGRGVGTIVDNEPRISISDVSKSEGKKNQTTLFTFTVTLSVPYDQPVTMSYRTADGTAKTSDQDYIAKTGTLTFAPGETTKTITIQVKGDSKKEASETFYLDLFGNSSNSLFTKNRGMGTIVNDD